jgi:hypothetical protein
MLLSSNDYEHFHVENEMVEIRKSDSKSIYIPGRGKYYGFGQANLPRFIPVYSGYAGIFQREQYRPQYPYLKPNINVQNGMLSSKKKKTVH